MSVHKHLFALALSATVLAFGTSTPAAAKPDNMTRHEGSAAMTRAVQDAQASLPKILDLTKESDTAFSPALLVKVAFPTEEGIENIWVGKVLQAGDSFAGQLANAPRFLPDADIGSDVTFEIGQIIDWAVPAGDGQYWGHYTTRVIADESEGDHRKSLLAVLTPTPVPSHW